MTRICKLFLLNIFIFQTSYGVNKICDYYFYFKDLKLVLNTEANSSILEIDKSRIINLSKDSLLDIKLFDCQGKCIITLYKNGHLLQERFYINNPNIVIDNFQYYNWLRKEYSDCDGEFVIPI